MTAELVWFSFFFSSRRRHTRCLSDWSSDVCSSDLLSSFFLLAATAAPGQSLTDITALVDERIQHLADEGPVDEEMERGLAQAEAHFMYRLQTVGGFGGKSDQLNAYNVLRGNPDFFAGDLERYRSATRESVRDAARAYLAFDRRVLLS